MSLDDWYESVWDALVDKVISLSEFTESTVFYGENFPANSFPSAFVCPGITNIEPITFQESLYKPLFEIGVVVENANAKTGKLEALKLCFKIAEALNNDRTLGNVLQKLECVQIVPNWRGLDTGMEQHYIAVVVECHRKL